MGRLIFKQGVTLIAPSIGGFPGQPGNPVGFAAAPGYPGSLTPFGGNGAQINLSPGTYNFIFFDAGTGGILLGSSGTYMFTGCQFASQQPANYNTEISGGAACTFRYCTFSPRPSVQAQPVNGGGYMLWPSGGARQNDSASGSATHTNYMIPQGNSSQYGIEVVSTAGPVSMDHCDMWGMANFIDFHGMKDSAHSFSITDCWFHDARSDAGGDHTDGPGDIAGNNGTLGWLTINHCTIASIGNTNGIAMQGPGPYPNLTLTNNYISGWGYQVSFLGTLTNCLFTDNVFGTDLQWNYGPFHEDNTAQFTSTTNVWRRNKLKIIPGTAQYSGANMPGWTGATDGQFLYPDSTYHSSDFTG